MLRTFFKLIFAFSERYKCEVNFFSYDCPIVPEILFEMTHLFFIEFNWHLCQNLIDLKCMDLFLNHPLPFKKFLLVY